MLAAALLLDLLHDLALHVVRRVRVVLEILLGSVAALTQPEDVYKRQPKICSAQWYKNGKPMAGYSNDHFEMTADAVSRITTYFTFTKDMEKMCISDRR